MFNGIAAKAIIPVTLTVTGFVIVGCLLLHSFIKQDLIANTTRQEVSLADTIVKSTRYAMLKTDREMLQQSLRDIGGQTGVEHVRIFNKKGIVMFSSDPTEIDRAVDKKSAGCSGCHSGATPATRLGPMEQARRFTNGEGKEVLAITAPIYNEASCAILECHPSLDEVKILGTLDIGLSTAPLQSALAQLRTRLAVFCLMVLFLTVGGVSALLLRNVLLPIRDLVGFAEDLAMGRPEPKSPDGSEEIDALVSSLRQLAAKGQGAAQEPAGNHDLPRS
ncbi:HAMP domain-containing protein [Desulfuromonas carbonis]